MFTTNQEIVTLQLMLSIHLSLYLHYISDEFFDGDLSRLYKDMCLQDIVIIADSLRVLQELIISE